MMMSLFFADHLAPGRAAPNTAPTTATSSLLARSVSKPKPLALKAFIAQAGIVRVATYGHTVVSVLYS